MAAQVNHLYGQASGQTRQTEDMLACLQRLSQQMDSQWRMQVVRTSTSKSDVWKRRVEQVAEETDALKAALDKYTHRERRCASFEAASQQPAPGKLLHVSFLNSRTRLFPAEQHKCWAASLQWAGAQRTRGVLQLSACCVCMG